ncbi:hypothetical protein ES707_10224 [subsurface metagenome]
MKQDYEQRKRFFQTLFDKTEGYIEIRTIGEKDKVKQFWYKISKLDRLLLELEKPFFKSVNTYFGVCPRREKEGTEKDVCQVRCLWVDLDAKNRNEKRAIKERLDDFDPEPSIIINSGNGFHCYWLFDKLEEISSPQDTLRLKGYNKGLAEELKGDKGIDLSRILRVPGTKNLKDPKETLCVTIIKFEPQIRYSLEGKFLARFKRDINNNEIEKVEIDQDSGNIPDRFWKVLEEHTKIRNTWKGTRKDLKDKTRSGYDMALSNLLMPFGFTDSELISILRESESGKGKEAKAQYLSVTIGKAKATWEKRKKEREKRLEDDKERLRSLIKEKPEKKEKKEAPPVKKSDRIFITGRQLVEEKIEKLEVPVGNGFFVPERYTILAASDGEGKTTFCIQLALSAITGITFLGFFPISKPAKVLYFCGENSRGDIKAKVGFQRIEIEKILKRSIIKELEENFILVEPININFWLNPKDNTELYNWIEEIKPNIVIFDPLADFISSQKSLSDDTLARGTVNTLTELAQKYKCFPIITTHLKKEAVDPKTGRSIVTLENVWDFVHGSRYWLNSAAAQIVMIRANLQRYPKAKKLVFKFKTVTEVKPLQVLRNPNLFYQELPTDKMSLASLAAEDVKDVLERRCKGQQVESLLIEAMRNDLGCGVTMARDLINTAIKTKLIYKDKKDNLIKVTLEVEKKLFNK